MSEPAVRGIRALTPVNILNNDIILKLFDVIFLHQSISLSVPNVSVATQQHNSTFKL